MSLKIARVGQDALPTCLSIRRKVFIEGQDVSEAEEVDGLDPDCLQYLVHLNDQAVATARIQQIGDTAKIQRVAVLDEARSAGIGSKLMRFMIADIQRDGAFKTIKLGAQTHAIGFYENLGFTAFGPEFDDAGIPHRDMMLKLS